MAAGTAILVVSIFASRRAVGQAPPATVAQVDLHRYQGRWFEVARLPLRWEAKCASDVTATYTLRSAAELDVFNECRKADGNLTRTRGTARLSTKDGSNAKLTVTFFWPFRGQYWILELDPEYRWAMVGTPNRRNLWVLSRTPHLEPGILEELLERAREQGFMTDAMIYTKQG